MKRALAWFVGLTLTSSAHAAPEWSSLWLTPDQRGEQLLRQGDAAGAARVYADPHRKAYAELKAGDYASAVQNLEHLDDSDAHYNRGNALVHAGQLQQALQAYDAALAKNPGNQDARHNRDLVEKALKQQQQPQQQGGSNNNDQKESGKGEQQQGKDSQQSSGASGQQKPNAGQNPQQSKADQQQSPGSGGGQNQGRQERDSPDKQDNSSAQSADKPNGSGQPPETADSAAQARRDAVESLRQASQAGQNGQAGSASDTSHTADADRQAATPSESLPRTEQQLAEQQWLRRIPDDPGGLLRRKFMIEHLLRQQEQQQEGKQP